VWEAYTIQNYIDAFAQLGFSVCQDPGEEPGIYKVAIFVDVVGVPTHAARQLDNGGWTSKLGSWVDIAHGELAGLEGEEYGSVEVLMSRRLVQPENR
jgi:hypothetical protein